MPLIKSGSPSAVSKNISEFHTGPTYAHTLSKFGKAKANAQAIAVALSNARKYKVNGGAVFARGGTPHYGGLIKSAIPGRTDKIPLNVPSGSYIVPADIPSAVGQGNTEAGSQILSKMFKIGPYGSGMTGAIHSGRPFQPKFDWMRFPRLPRQPAQPRQEGGPTAQIIPFPLLPRQQGGETGEVPIIAAGGEMVIPPHVVREIGNGDLKAGHRVLDALVLSIRKQHIHTLKNLKPPKQ